MTSKDQRTLPKSVTTAVGSTEDFNVKAQNGPIVLTPVRLQQGDAARAQLAELDLSDKDLADAVTWSRKPATTSRKK